MFFFQLNSLTGGLASTGQSKCSWYPNAQVTRAGIRSTKILGASANQNTISVDMKTFSKNILTHTNFHWPSKGHLKWMALCSDINSVTHTPFYTITWDLLILLHVTLRNAGASGSSPTPLLGRHIYQPISFLYTGDITSFPSGYTDIRLSL